MNPVITRWRQRLASREEMHKRSLALVAPSLTQPHTGYFAFTALRLCMLSPDFRQQQETRLQKALFRRAEEGEAQEMSCWVA